MHFLSVIKKYAITAASAIMSTVGILFFIAAICFFLPSVQIIARIAVDGQKSNQVQKKEDAPLTLPWDEQKFGQGEKTPDIILKSADEGKYISMEGRGRGYLELKGRVHLIIRERSLYADKVIVNLHTQEIFGSGKIAMVDKNGKTSGHSFYYDQKRDHGVLYHSKAYKRPFYYQGGRVRQINPELSIMDEGALTTCDLDCPHYKFIVDKVWIYGDRKVFAQDVTVIVGNTSVFYLPFIYQTEEGSGIISRLGSSDRKGIFLQNTVNLSFYPPENNETPLEQSGASDDKADNAAPFAKAEHDPQSLPLDETQKIKTKWMFDYYQRSGQYFSQETKINREKMVFYNRIGYARHLPVDYDTRLGRFRNLVHPSDVKKNSQLSDQTQSDSSAKLQLDEDANGDLWVQHWYSLDSRLDTAIYDDPWGSHRFSYHIKWYNHAYMPPFFEDRLEPKDTFQMVDRLNIPNTIGIPMNSLQWLMNYERKGEKSLAVISAQRNWQWDYSRTFLDMNANYLPLQDRLPRAVYHFSDDFYVQGEQYQQQLIFGADVAGDFNRFFDNTGGMVYRYWDSHGLAYIKAPIILFSNLLSYTPQIGYGYNYREAIEPTPAQLEAARKQTYQFYDTLQNLRLGPSYLYLDNSYQYRQSFADQMTEEPFYNQRINQYTPLLFFAIPVSDFSAKMYTTYDFRSGFENEFDHWHDYKATADWMIDLVNFLDSDRRQFFNQYRLMFARLHMKSAYNYIIRIQKHGIADSLIAYETGNFAFKSIDRVRMLSLGLRWLHDFNNDLRDRIYLAWSFQALISRDWTVNVGGNSILEQVYRYSADRKPLTDISQSVNIFDDQQRTDSLFRVQALYLNVIHDLHCWELILGWQMTENIIPFGVQLNHRLSYYEKVFYFEFRSKELSNVGLQRTEAYRFIPDPEHYQR